MKPAPFELHVASSVADAVAALGRYAPAGGRIIAGGQSLLPMMAFRLAQPSWLIDINRVPGLDRLAVEDGALRIGAAVRHAAFCGPGAAAPEPLGALMRSVARHIAHWPIRAHGTFCGSLANADPASEWLTLFAALDGTALAHGPNGRRTLPAATFARAIMTTALQEDELLEEARLPLLPPDTRWGFCEHSRRAGDYALAMAVVTYRLDADGRIAGARIASGGVEARPRRLAEAEAALDGAAPSPAAFARAAEAAAAAIAPLEDAQADAAHRRDLLRACVRRALASSL
jgi:carbon-monoxide dehydrogenase medium subunit